MNDSESENPTFTSPKRAAADARSAARTDAYSPPYETAGTMSQHGGGCGESKGRKKHTLDVLGVRAQQH